MSIVPDFSVATSFTVTLTINLLRCAYFSHHWELDAASGFEFLLALASGFLWRSFEYPQTFRRNRIVHRWGTCRDSQGCVSQGSYPRTSVLREPGTLGSKHTVKFSKGTWHLIEIRERNGASRGIIQKCAPHERSPCALKFEERSHEETLTQERCARKTAWDFAIFSLAQEFRQSHVLCSWWSYWYAGTYNVGKTRRARIRSPFRSIDAHDEQKKN